MKQFKYYSLSLLRGWIGFVQHYRVLVLVLTIAATLFAFQYAKNNLGMNTEARNMLSPELPWRQFDLEYDRLFPEDTDNLLVVIEANTADQAEDAARLLYQALLKETRLFKSVYYPQALPLFRESGLLFLDTEELQDLSDRLAAIQPFLSRLIQDQSLRGLFSMLSEALDAQARGEQIDITPLLTQINTALVSARHQQAYRVSWRRLMSGGDKTNRIQRQFIILQPNLDFSSLFPAKAAVNRLHELSEKLGIEKDIGARMRLTGSVALAYEELLSVTRGTEIAVVLALGFVSLIMLFGLGSLRLVLATLVTLITGLILTAAFAAFAVGELNLISVAFAVLYIGLGVDFAIHYCLRYRELHNEGKDNSEAIRECSVNIGSSMFLCAATTAIGFYAFIPTDYDGVAELGLISGTGMFISLAVTLTLLPALLSLFPFRTGRKKRTLKKPEKINRLLSFPFTHGRSIRRISLLLALISISLLTQLRFDRNTLNLQDPHNESVKTFKDLLADSDTSPWTGIVLAKGREDAVNLIEKYKRLPLVDKTVWLEDFIPQDQDEKLAIIEEMNLLLADLPEETDSTPVTDKGRLNAVKSLTDKLQSMRLTPDQPELTYLRRNLRSYLEDLSRLDISARAQALKELEQSLLGSLPGRLEDLRASLNAHNVTIKELPQELTRRWYNKEAERYLIEISPRENVQHNGALRRFVTQLQNTEPRTIGSPVIRIEAGDTVVKAFQQAFLYAFGAITLLLLILLRYKRDTLYILLPLLLAAICTGAISVLLNIPLNFANIIALPLLLGIGVDSGIHIMHRFRTAMPTDNNLLATSSAKAILVSALTTIGGIGNLAFSPHAGTASMGELLSIGIGMTLICMLIVLPSLLARQL
ncbi:MAG: MMPL family transporter [Gammaproteobacteria bacterium]